MFFIKKTVRNSTYISLYPYVIRSHATNVNAIMNHPKPRDIWRSLAFTVYSKDPAPIIGINNLSPD